MKNIFKFKFNITALKIFLLLSVITFFMPFFSVSCGGQEIILTGAALSFGKNIGSYHQNGNIFALVIIIPVIALFILSFFIYKTKKILLFKNIFLIVPVFDIFSAFVIKSVLKQMILRRTSGSAAESFLIKFAEKNITVNIKYGFVLYIIFNAIVFIFASVNYFVKRE